jgi:hypothetical protein
MVPVDRRRRHPIRATTAANSRRRALETIEGEPDRTKRLLAAANYMRAAVHCCEDDQHAQVVAALVQLAVDLNIKKVLASRSVTSAMGEEDRWSIREADRIAAEERHADYTVRIAKQKDRRWRLAAAIDYLRAVGHDAPDAALDEVVVTLIGIGDRFESRRPEGMLW